MYRTCSTALSLFLAFVLSVTPVLGQQSHTAESISLPTPISASELDATAELYTQIETIYADYEAKLIRAETDAERTAIEVKREAEIQNILRDAASLTAERYRTILNRANEKANLENRLEKRIRQARQQSRMASNQNDRSTLDSKTSQKQCSPSPPDSNAE